MVTHVCISSVRKPRHEASQFVVNQEHNELIYTVRPDQTSHKHKNTHTRKHARTHAHKKERKKGKEKGGGDLRGRKEGRCR